MHGCRELLLMYGSGKCMWQAACHNAKLRVGRAGLNDMQEFRNWPLRGIRADWWK